MEKGKGYFSKERLCALIQACERTISLFIHSDASMNIHYTTMEKFVHTLMSYECLFGYLYAEVYKYGTITDVINPGSDVYARYTLTASLVFTEPQAFTTFLHRLPTSWHVVENMVERCKMSINNDMLFEDIAILSEAVKSSDKILLAQ